MSSATLTTHDLFVLEKIKDPESGPAPPLLISESLPKDPYITDQKLYQSITQQEREIISTIQEIELQIAGLKPSSQASSPLSQYLICVKKFDRLIEDYPNYASARNNRAQALRRIYGDTMLVKSPLDTSGEQAMVLDPRASDTFLMSMSKQVLEDLTTAISLLTPKLFSPLSTQAAKTLSQAYTQRGALYHLTAKCLSSKDTVLRIDKKRKEVQWKVIDFEENASADFMMGGRYGNEIAKALVVTSNPTAKLCGDIVREAMSKEYAGV